jgi:hypothetical protein
MNVVRDIFGWGSLVSFIPDVQFVFEICGECRE